MIPAITKNAPRHPSSSIERAKIGLITNVPAPGPAAIIPVADERYFKKYLGTVTNTLV